MTHPGDPSCISPAESTSIGMIDVDSKENVEIVEPIKDS